ncbi:MAG: hypothetical protein Q7R30_24660 [Acidobacteriota bacterium]|nr:hypothetical protein [Acidobacteriota bacterium]
MNMIAVTSAGLMVSVLLGPFDLGRDQDPVSSLAQGKLGQTPAPQAQRPDTQKVTPEVQAKAKLLDVTRIGCLKAWQPGPPDATRAPDPPRTGTYILTPLVVDPNRATADMPTYLLVGGATVSFPAHVNHKVEISGVESVAQLAPTPQEIAAAPALRTENKPDTRTMPSLTVQSLKMISTACP